MSFDFMSFAGGFADVIVDKVKAEEAQAREDESWDRRFKKQQDDYGYKNDSSNHSLTTFTLLIRPHIIGVDWFKVITLISFILFDCF